MLMVQLYEGLRTQQTSVRTAAGVKGECVGKMRVYVSGSVIRMFYSRSRFLFALPLV